MIDALIEYGLFFAKSFTLLIAFLLLLAGIAALSQRHRKESHGQIEVRQLNHEWEQQADILREAVLSGPALKAWHKERKNAEKTRKKADLLPKKRIYVIDFKGDIRASQTHQLRETITAILAVATAADEVLVRLESSGGMVHSYGFAASQLDRIRSHGVPLTICVDMMAASGGYMMACIANRLLAAPFAMIGSIGVVAQLPNFHRLLKKHEIDYELLTAGEYKRTLTLFGENGPKGREKFIEELEETHALFKSFVTQHRPQLDIDQVATGEVWYGQRALAKGLIDELMTSDEYLSQHAKEADIFKISYIEKRSIAQRMGLTMSYLWQTVTSRLLHPADSVAFSTGKIPPVSAEMDRS